MPLKKVLSGLIFIQIFSLFSCSENKVEEKPGLPNIILCMSDDQGWGDMGYQGHPILKTPNFDEMALNGIRFDRFYAASPVCSPTRASVLTGRHGNRMGCFNFGFDINPNEITIPQMLKKKSYQTAHFGKWHIGSIRTESVVNPGNMGFDDWLTSSNEFELNPYLSRNGVVEKIEGEGSMVIVKEALKYIKKNKNSDKPFFIVLWFSSPHNPHQAYKKHKKIYSDQPNNYKDFFAEISALDEAMGELREGLEDFDLAYNTLLWFNGDNGGNETMGMNGGNGSKGSMYEGGLRVPAIIEWPAKIPKGSISTFPASTSDIFPTLLEIAGLKLEHNYPIDGISLLKEFEHPGSKREKPIFFWDYYTDGIVTAKSESTTSLFTEQESIEKKPEKDINYSFSTRRFKSLDYYHGHSVILSWPHKFHRKKLNNGPIQIELFDLQKDPSEGTNIAYLKKNITDSLNQQLLEWQISVNKSYLGSDY